MVVFFDTTKLNQWVGHINDKYHIIIFF